MIPHDSLEKRAEEISLNIPGNWPDDKSWKIRVEYVLKALLETAEKAEREAIKRCVDIANNEIETFRMIRRDGGPAEIVRNQILKFLDLKPEE